MVAKFHYSPLCNRDPVQSIFTYLAFCKSKCCFFTPPPFSCCSTFSKMPSTHGLHGNILIIYSLLVVDGQDGQHGQKGQPCSCNISIFHNSCKLQLLKITAYAFIHQTCMAISCRSLSFIKLFHRRQPQVISHGYFFTHLFKLLESFLTKLMHNISSKYVIPRHHIW